MQKIKIERIGQTDGRRIGIETAKHAHNWARDSRGIVRCSVCGLPKSKKRGK